MLVKLIAKEKFINKDNEVIKKGREFIFDTSKQAIASSKKDADLILIITINGKNKSLFTSVERLKDMFNVVPLNKLDNEERLRKYYAKCYHEITYKAGIIFSEKTMGEVYEI